MEASHGYETELMQHDFDLVFCRAIWTDIVSWLNISTKWENEFTFQAEPPAMKWMFFEDIWRPNPPMETSMWHHPGILWIFMGLCYRHRCCYDLAPGWLHSISGALSTVNWIAVPGVGDAFQTKLAACLWHGVGCTKGLAAKQSQSESIRDSVLTSCPSHIWFQGES